MAGKLSLFAPDVMIALYREGGPQVNLDRWPAFATFLGRADRRPLAHQSSELNLLEVCGVEPGSVSTISIAALCAAVDGIDATGDMLFRVDPVHLRADPNQILLFSDETTSPSLEEADALLDYLNAALDSPRFHRGAHAARWYAAVPYLDASTSSPRSVNGHSIAPHRPRGTGRAHLERLMNDVQMALHDAPVNDARSAAGRLPINAVWVWGGGSVTRPARTDLTPRGIYGDDVLAAALSRLMDIPWDASVGAASLLARPREIGHSVVICGRPHGGVTAPVATVSLDDMEREWMRPLLAKLRTGQVSCVDLITDRHCYSLNRRGVWRVWRTPQRQFDLAAFDS